MSHEDSLRIAAVIAAAALVAAPYWQHVKDAAAIAWEYAKARAGATARIAAAVLIVAAAWGKIPMPTLPAVAPTINVQTPSESMQTVVAPVAAALRSLPMGSRMLWAQTWNKAALVVAGDAIGVEVAFTDTRSLRKFTSLALDIAWRRIGGNAPGNEPLRQAVEAAYASVVGDADVSVTKDVRDRYAELARAIAWAGLNGG